MTVMMKAKEAADLVYEAVRTRVEQLNGKGVRPQLAALLVDGDPASAYYAQAKRKVADKLGVQFQLHTFDKNVSEKQVLDLIDRLNKDPEVHGMMLELPLPDHLNTPAIVKSVSPAKDIDGITPDNKLATITGEIGLYPATPQACIRLLKHYGYRLAGKHVVLVGRGQTVGLPLFHMLQREQATVTVCHSRTPDIGAHLRHADIAFVAVGRPETVNRHLVHSELVVIDAGINEGDNGRMIGDVAQDVAEHVAAITPVPGGVGTLTTALLFENLLKAVDIQLQARGGEL
ncbi:Bifunctional protein FolD protein [Paenibacillus konkukensis]|uniref:Bifunctional protein FolD n=1 Tax=Paenibacillus konkukensis TaxID=2020716 RepID=A0ABY4RPL9_9BACL|nr:bifunctional 5,10-methylenetetrahydrofolate dehydrogenase/5,10-methenyltetrahydrofolate cyclohydrolase [Paenibacillus konkukensis]UQZ83354.1 Bifunctional protein FolD protein [Paenibacillus konkukensis]